MTNEGQITVVQNIAGLKCSYNVKARKQQSRLSVTALNIEPTEINGDAKLAFLPPWLMKWTKHF